MWGQVHVRPNCFRETGETKILHMKFTAKHCEGKKTIRISIVRNTVKVNLKKKNPNLQIKTL